MKSTAFSSLKFDDSAAVEGSHIAWASSGEPTMVAPKPDEEASQVTCTTSVAFDSKAVPFHEDIEHSHHLRSLIALLDRIIVSCHVERVARSL